jgi:branched-chain amino acid transport system ATP-binding protein
MNEILEIRDLSVNYGYVTALREVALQVRTGEIVTLIGSNGAGKSSMLMSVSNLVQGKKTGSIRFEGQEISSMDSSCIVRLGISHIPEGRHIFSRLTVLENLIMGTFGSPKYHKDEAKAMLEEVFQLFPRLKERSRQMGGTLSGGEQQMLAIGRGLMFSPKLLMLDEPSLGLAPLVIEEIFELILHIRARGTTVLLIEQNAGLALKKSDEKRTGN